MDTSHVTWRKASYSQANSNCIEVGTWHKSTHSAQNSTCIEVGASREPGADLLCLVRDTKDQGGPALAFTPAAWATFIAGVKTGAFDRIA
ncbi:MAG TPA: DUF397 domain-containing protein [Streptosporangiaceae bacterium]|jgi:hypothetical protein